jgi:hypothetical protein
MTANYSTFFSIQLFHEYFLSGKCEGIEIVPTEDCRAIARKMDLLFRFSGDRLVALIKENDLHQPFVNIPPSRYFRKYHSNAVFRFYITIRNPLFLNFTNIDYSYNTGRKFYFSNLSGNHHQGVLHLTRPVSQYAPGTTYLPGALVSDPETGNVYEAIVRWASKKKKPFSDLSSWTPRDLLHASKPIEEQIISKNYLNGDLVRRPGSNDIYEAAKKHVSKSEAELDDTGLWHSRGQGQLQFVTGDDSIEYCNGNFFFNLPAPVTHADIVISGFNYNSAAPAFDVPVVEKNSIDFKDATAEVPVRLSSLDPGKYQITVNNETKLIYYDRQLTEGNILGVIEIFNHLPGTDQFSLLDDDEKIKNVLFSIQFPNRRVLWRYKPKDGKAKSITDTGDTGLVFRLLGDDFVSERPIPLSQNVVKTLKLDFNTADFSLFPLPNPAITRLAKCNYNDIDYLCTDVYLNY